MRVHELIARLQDQDPYALVAVSTHTGEIEECYGCSVLEEEVNGWPENTILIQANR